jgi:cation diffusion facilitator CzcD-associated flavoprotein CzcO
MSPQSKVPVKRKHSVKKPTTKKSAKKDPTRTPAAKKVTAKKVSPKKTAPGRQTPAHADVLIIGAGFTGLGTAIRLRQAGIHNIIILERSNEVGGTWRDNQYPGAACDIPSNLYSYSFVQNPDWSRSFSGSQEILNYIHGIVEKFDLKPLIRFGQDVRSLTFDEKKGEWYAGTVGGKTFTGRALVMSSGPLANASLPNIAGLEQYQGHKIHSARWDHDYDFTGKRVAVIGTGASAVQIIPELVKQAEQVKVFQRTPGWVMPRPNFASPEWQKTLFRQLPATQTALRQTLFWGHEVMALGLIWNTPLTRLLEQISKAHLWHQVKDPWLRRQLTPNFTIGCKRVLVSSDYYPALQQDNCELITWPIATLSKNGIRTAEGIEHQVDCIVFATGYEVYNNRTPFPVFGLNGRELGTEWTQGAQAYKSVSVAGYPNLFMTPGPNSGPGHNSFLVYMEAEIDYTVRGIQTLLNENLKVLDVTEEAQTRFNRGIQKRLAKTNWNSGCKSWYLTEDGFNATMFPGFATQFANQLKQLERDHYHMVRA